MNNDRVWRLDGFHYCEGTAESDEDALASEAFENYVGDEEIVFYFVVPENKYYLADEVEVFYE